MSDLIASIVSLTIGVAFAVALARRVPRSERAPIYVGYAAHVAFGLLNVMLTYFYYGDGDMTSYIRLSQGMADVIRQDPGHWTLPYLRHAFFPFSEHLPEVGPGNHGPTQAVYVINLFVCAFSFLSKGALYFVFRELFPARFRRRIALGLMAVPSIALWSGSLMKEGLVWMTAGWVVWGYYQAFHKRRRMLGLTVMALAAVPVALIKAYVLFPMVIGFGVWSYWSSARYQGRAIEANVRPLVLLVRGALVFAFATAGLLGLGQLFPRYDITNLTTEATELQEIGGTVDGGSNFSIVNRTGLMGQVAAGPYAIFTAIFRPLLVEARSPVAAANSMETTLLFLLFLWILKRRGLRLVTLIRGSPALMFCLVYVILFAVAVGLTTTNLGTLSRYRMPLMPFLCVMFAVLAPMRETSPPQQGRRRPRSRHPGSGTSPRDSNVVALRDRRSA
jgi:hypothetical protein